MAILYWKVHYAVLDKELGVHSKYNQKPCDQIYSSDDMLD